MILVNITEQVIITAIIEDMEVKLIVKVMKGSGEYMTEKRFILDDCGTVIDVQTRDTFDYVVDVIDLLNSLNDENEEFKKALIELKEIGDYQYGRIKELSDENEQLKQRNTNHYNQLNELWEIIEEENWGKLIAMKKQLKEDEERLQKEWKHYE